MSTPAQKTPLVLSVNQAAGKIVNDYLQLEGKALPCSVVSNKNSIVTVKFEVNGPYTLPQVTIPLFGPEYVRYPIAAGCKGMVLAADAHLGGMSGLGGGVSDLGAPGNLSALVFLPISNTAWQAVDQTTVTAYASNGVVLRDTGNNTSFVLTPTSITMIATNAVTITCGAASIKLTPTSWALSGPSGTMTDGTAHTSPTIMNSAWAALVSWLNTHVHTSAGAGSPTSAPNTPFTGGSIAPT
jgi:hypothetical protein